ncbi:MAG: hypothetical protein RL385_1485 [Pseudomonadota bacterium]
MEKLTERSELRRIPWLRLSVLAALIAIPLALAPLIWVALQAGAGVVLLGALLTAGALSLRALPFLGKRLEMRLLRAQFANARANPMEELLGQLLQREDQLGRYRSAIANVAAQIEGMREMLEQRKLAAPQYDTRRQIAALQKMEAFQAHHLENLTRAEHALADFGRHLSQKRFEWSFAEAGNSVLASLRSSERENIMRDLLQDEASRAIQRTFDQAFASLDIELRTVQRHGVAEDLPLPPQPRTLP